MNYFLMQKLFLKGIFNINIKKIDKVKKIALSIFNKKNKGIKK